MYYNDFSRTAANWSKWYNKEKIENYIRAVLDNNEEASACDNHIRELDETEKKSPDIEDLIIARQKAEVRIKELDREITSLETEHKKYEIYLKNESLKYDRLTNETEEGEKALYKINLLRLSQSTF